MSPAGRPRTFDRELALKKAMYLFWKKGYEGTTMSDLIDSIGMKAPSVYAAFGNKDAIFKEAVTLYAGYVENGPLKALADTPSLREAMKIALKETIDLYSAGDNTSSCLIMVGAINASPEHQEHIDALKDLRESYKRAWLNRFIQAEEDGQLIAGASPQDLAEYMITFLHGLAMRAKDGSGKIDLESSTRLVLNGLDSLIKA